MSFDVFLVPSSTTPAADLYGATALEALRAAEIQPGRYTGEWRTVDGAFFDLDVEGGNDAMFELRTFTPSIAAAIFALADQTASFVVPASEVSCALRTPANRGAPPDDFPSITDVADVQALVQALEAGFAGWSEFRDKVVAPPPSQSTLGRLWRRLTGSDKS